MPARQRYVVAVDSGVTRYEYALRCYARYLAPGITLSLLLLLRRGCREMREQEARVRRHEFAIR